MIAYLKKHWRGEHSLAWSVFVNWAPLFLLLWALEETNIRLITKNPDLAFRVFLLWFPIALLAVYPWILVGVIRSSEKYLSEYGNPVIGRIAQAAVLIAGISLLISGAGVVQRIGAHKEELAFEKKWIETTTRHYDITRIEGSGLIRLNGPMQNGTTNYLEGFLKEQEGVTGIILNSKGGRVYEGRGVSRVIRENALDTYVEEECLSACTLAYIGGQRRHLKSGARLGFHQYAYASAKNLGYLDSDEEQAKDYRLIQAQGVSEAFLAKVFSASKDDMWFPDEQTLLNAGFIHAVEAPPY